ncbi:hypothetical protein V2J09_013203 [Rumex salicifolius]
MQTKKKANSRTSARDAVSPKSLKNQKKRSEKAQIEETKAGDLITSSVRKAKSSQDGVLAKGNGGSDVSDLNAKYKLLQDETHNVCSPGSDTVIAGSLTLEERSGGAAHSESETIFSPHFHLSRNVEDRENGADTNDDSISTEVSAIYFIANSKLECLDECGQDSMAADTCRAEDEYEDFDDFDPYLFIKNLPALSAVVPTFRPVLLPKKTRRCPRTTLVLDLDETLVHSSLEPCHDVDFTFSVNFNERDHTVYVRCRPHLQDFMERVAGLFEIIIFTASQSIYAEKLLNVLDPKRRIVRHRIYRESCVFVDGNYIKDLSVLGRDLSSVIIVDNSPQAFGFQVDNGIPIQSWFEDRSDNELLLLIPFLESLIGIEDVRPVIAQRYKLKHKIASAYSSRELFETS